MLSVPPLHHGRSRIGAIAVALFPPLALSACCCGARTGPREPMEPAVTFIRSVGVRNEIWQAAPFASVPEGRVRIGGVSVLDHDVHPPGELIAFSTAEGLFIRGLRSGGGEILSQDGIDGIAWSPDASRIAFTRSGQLWETGAFSGSTPRPVTQAPAHERDWLAMSPVWSPDGRALYFIRYRQDVDGRGDPVVRDHQIWRVGLDDRNAQRVHSGEPAPLWSGLAMSLDGSVLLYASGERTRFIVRLHLPTGTAATLVPDAVHPAFSSSGGSVAFVRGGAVWTCRYTGTECTRERRISNGTTDRAPSWAGG